MTEPRQANLADDATEIMNRLLNARERLGLTADPAKIMGDALRAYATLLEGGVELADTDGNVPMTPSSCVLLADVQRLFKEGGHAKDAAEIVQGALCALHMIAAGGAELRDLQGTKLVPLEEAAH